MKKKIALITGVTGQDGSYLAEFLIKKKISQYLVNCVYLGFCFLQHLETYLYQKKINLIF